MISFINNSDLRPYIEFRNEYDKALSLGQKNIEAISISSFNRKADEVNSRFVNLKIIDHEDFIFFSNYNSPKSDDFNSHNQISVSIFWQKSNTQIRIKASIKKTSSSFNNDYFKNRSPEKNALAISSNQSSVIDSYNSVIDKYNKTLSQEDLQKCPNYWGGYVFKPYLFEFWKGHNFRLNLRNQYSLIDGNWVSCILEP